MRLQYHKRANINKNLTKRRLNHRNIGQHIFYSVLVLMWQLSLSSLDNKKETFQNQSLRCCCDKNRSSSSLRCFYTPTGVHLWYRYHHISEKPDHEARRTSSKAKRLDCVEAQICRRLQIHFSCPEGSPEQSCLHEPDVEEGRNKQDWSQSWRSDQEVKRSTASAFPPNLSTRAEGPDRSFSSVKDTWTAHLHQWAELTSSGQREQRETMVKSD